MTETTDWPNNECDFNRWYHDLTAFVEILSKAESGYWCEDHQLKYLNIRVDSRNCRFVLLVDDRDGGKERISPNRVIAAIKKWERK